MKKSIILLPKTQRILEMLGENIKLARLRRKLSASQVAQRANISRYTVGQIEKGAAGVSLGTLLQVLFVFDLETDFEKLASNDPLGRKLQDADLKVKERAPKRNLKSKIDGGS